jgi:excisionase family DNA binding protein
VVKVASNINDDLLGTSGAASILQCSEATIRKHADTGRLPCIRDSSNKRLFKRTAVEAYKRKHPVSQSHQYRDTSAAQRVQ